MNKHYLIVTMIFKLLMLVASFKMAQGMYKFKFDSIFISIVSNVLNVGCATKKLTSLAGCQIKSTWLIFKNKMLIYQSKANVDVKIPPNDSTHPLDL